VPRKEGYNNVKFHVKSKLLYLFVMKFWSENQNVNFDNYYMPILFNMTHFSIRIEAH